MKVGFLGFGEVASTLTEGIMKNGADVYTCVRGRSSRTRKTAEKSGVKLYPNYKELAENSDILISTVVPSKAVDVAKLVGNYSKGIYIDMNNVSPQTVKNALMLIKNGKTVDAAIIGSVIKNGVNIEIIASGPCAKEIVELENYGMNITVVGEENGQASGIKLLRSAYTKGVSALLFESVYHGYKMGIDVEVLKYISETECKDFIESAVSRLISAAFHAQRRSEEMDQVVEMLNEKQDPVMAKATSDFFNTLKENIKRPAERPDNYLEVFKLLNENHD
jgi:3-hydroxyisobutyrate dehydrogenase-like beta-hydroxyacid dehydrogenase